MNSTTFNDTCQGFILPRNMSNLTNEQVFLCRSSGLLLTMATTTFVLFVLSVNSETFRREPTQVAKEWYRKRISNRCGILSKGIAGIAGIQIVTGLVKDAFTGVFKDVVLNMTMYITAYISWRDQLGGVSLLQRHLWLGIETGTVTLVFLVVLSKLIEGAMVCWGNMPVKTIVIADEEAFLELKQELGQAYLLVGFGSKGLYANFENVKAQIDEAVDHLNDTVGTGKWFIVFGGDRYRRQECDIAHLAKYFTKKKVKVVAVQFAGKEIDKHIHYKFQYKKDAFYDTIGAPYLSSGSRTLYGGWYGALMRPGDGIDQGLAGASKFYFRELGTSFLSGVLAFGGGMTSCQDVRYALRIGVKVWFFHCSPAPPDGIEYLWKSCWWDTNVKREWLSDSELSEMWLQNMDWGAFKKLGPVRKLFRNIVDCHSEACLQRGKWLKVKLNVVDPLFITCSENPSCLEDSKYYSPATDL